MTWLFDLGNTRLKWARVDNGELRERGVLAHGEPGFERALDARLAELPRAERALLASVAGEDLTARVAALAARHGVPCERVRTQSEFAGLRIAYAEPARLGVDRFLALLGAHRRGPGPWLIVSVGTALTLDLLADGAHLGGLIAPSPALMRQMLALRVPALDVAGGNAVDFARCTEDALAGGTVGAALGLIERSHAQAATVLGAAPTLLLAGGGGDALRPALRVPALATPDLVLEGLAFRAGRAP